MKNTEKEERALDALISVALLHKVINTNERDNIISEMEDTSEDEVTLSNDDELALSNLGTSLFTQEAQRDSESHKTSNKFYHPEFSETVFAMGRNGDNTDIDEEIKKEIEERRRKILDELKKKDDKKVEN